MEITQNLSHPVRRNGQDALRLARAWLPVAAGVIAFLIAKRKRDTGFLRAVGSASAAAASVAALFKTKDRVAEIAQDVRALRREDPRKHHEDEQQTEL